MYNAMPENFRKYFEKNQTEYSNYREWLSKEFFIYVNRDLPNPTMHPGFQPKLIMNADIMEIGKNMTLIFGYSGAISALKTYVGYHTNCKPIIPGTPFCWDVRPVIVNHAISWIWYNEMYEKGYRLLTENAAKMLCENGTTIILRRNAPHKSDWAGNPAKQGNRSIKLVNPSQHIIDDLKRVSYNLLNIKSCEVYLFSILAVSSFDTASHHMWLYKEPAINL